MKSGLLILVLVLSGLSAPAQNDTENLIRTITLDSAQQQWLKNNYIVINTQSREIARATIVKTFPDISNSLIEFMIGEAGKMAKEDQKPDIATVAQFIRKLTAEIEALGEKIARLQKKIDELEAKRENQSEQKEREREKLALLKEMDTDKSKLIQLDSLIRIYRTNSKSVSGE
jgi:chromosome segregation ATPase